MPFLHCSHMPLEKHRVYKVPKMHIGKKKKKASGECCLETISE